MTMRSGEISGHLQTLISDHLLTMDHVDVLLAVRRDVDRGHSPREVAQRTGLPEHVVASVLSKLAAAQLMRRDQDLYWYAPSDEMRGAADDLADMYGTRPVTLVRAIHEHRRRAV